MPSVKRVQSFEIDESLLPIKERVERLPCNSEINPDLALEIRRLWLDEAVQKAHHQPTELYPQYPSDAVAYWLNHLPDIVSSDRLLTDADILHSPLWSVGSSQHKYSSEGQSFQIIDVGDVARRRSERSAAFQLHSHVQAAVGSSISAVLCVVDASEYDQVN